jgi:hypothetical protein
VESLGNHITCKWRKFDFSLSYLYPFYLFFLPIALANNSSTILDLIEESGHPRPISNFRGIEATVLVFSHLVT